MRLSTSSRTRGIVVLALVALIGVACRRAPAANTNTQSPTAIPNLPAATSCPDDVLTCPDGSVHRRQLPYCLFAACPQSPDQACPTDTQTCADGSVVKRQGPTCTFPDCPNVHQDQSYRPR